MELESCTCKPYQNCTWSLNAMTRMSKLKEDDPKVRNSYLSCKPLNTGCLILLHPPNFLLEFRAQFEPPYYGYYSVMQGIMKALFRAS